MAGEGQTCRAETSCRGWGKGGRKEQTLLLTKREMKKTATESINTHTVFVWVSVWDEYS